MLKILKSLFFYDERINSKWEKTEHIGPRHLVPRPALISPGAGQRAEGGVGLVILAAPPPPTGPGDRAARSGGTLISPFCSASTASSVTSCQTQKYLLVRLLRRRLCEPHCRDAMHPSLFSIKDITCRVRKRERSEFCKEETVSTPPSGRAQETPDTLEGPGPGRSCL